MPISFEENFTLCDVCSSRSDDVYHWNGYDIPQQMGVSSTIGLTRSEVEHLIFEYNNNENNTTGEENEMPENETVWTMDPTAAQLRRYAREQGYWVANSGPIAAWIREQYLSTARRELSESIPIPRPTVAYRHTDHFEHEGNALCIARFFGADCNRPHEEETAPEGRYYELVSTQGYGMLRGDSVRIYSQLNNPSVRRRVAWWGQPQECFTIEGVWSYWGDNREFWASNIRPRLNILPCAGCGSSRETDRVTVGDGEYCYSCVSECYCHNEWQLNANVVYAAGETYCRGHEPHCPRCDQPMNGSYEYDYTANERVCSACVPRCPNCLRALDRNSSCRACAENQRRRFIRRYGKTHPSMMLGGEDAKYHIGFELEVTAAYDDNPEPLKQWAQSALGHWDALDLKEDGSVDGFEIVSQPMTPEFFESVDWAEFFATLNNTLIPPRNGGDEPERHGLHVHIGRGAFKDDAALAAFCYLIARDEAGNMTRISRRQATGYCTRISNPVSQALVQGKHPTMRAKMERKRVFTERGAVNLGNRATVEIRSGKSTRRAENLIAQVRMVYLAAEYIAALQEEHSYISPRHLSWAEFAKWVGKVRPDAYPVISGNNDNN